MRSHPFSNKSHRSFEENQKRQPLSQQLKQLHNSKGDEPELNPLISQIEIHTQSQEKAMTQSIVRCRMEKPLSRLLFNGQKNTNLIMC